MSAEPLRKNTMKAIRACRPRWCLAAALAVASAHASALGGYQFCESPGPGPRAYVSPVFDGERVDPHGSFERYLAGRYRLADVHARCFTLPTEREARQFRTQRIEILHWDGWQHVIATPWTPGSEAAVAGADDRG
jgi:hypothetical protein